MSQRSFAGVVGAAAVLAASAGIAHAGYTDPGFTFSATNAQGTGTVAISLAQGAPLPNGGWQWVLVGPPIPIMNGPVVLGTITQGSITMVDSTSLVASSFAVTAGNSATNFVLSSGETSFGTMTNPSARASAGLTVTDNNGNGASITGNLAGGNVYTSHYNGLAPAGTAFANLITGPLAEPNPFGSEATSQAFPAAPGAFAPIVGSVSSMSAMWDFTVTAGDQASGTSVFVLVPAPGSLALLGLGGLAMARRRRA